MNPVWHVHNSKIPNENMIMSFSMLLNLVETSNADNKDLLWKFVKKYKENISEKDHPIFDNLVDYAIKYFNSISQGTFYDSCLGLYIRMSLECH